MGPLLPRLLLEPAIGRLRFALIYFVSLLCGSFGALLVDPHSVTVGASGAIFGLMGAAAVEMRARQVPIFQSGVGTLIVLNLVISFSIPGISYAGHIGGLIGGAVAAAVLRFGDVRRNQVLALIGCVAIGVAAFAGSIATAHSSKPEALEVGSSSPVQPGTVSGSLDQPPRPRARVGTRSGWRMWASSSSPSTSLGPGREK